jgi:hypothetical protein
MCNKHLEKESNSQPIFLAYKLKCKHTTQLIEEYVKAKSTETTYHRSRFKRIISQLDCRTITFTYSEKVTDARSCECESEARERDRFKFSKVLRDDENRLWL